MGKQGNRYGEGTFLLSKMFLSPAFLSLGLRGSSPVVSNCSAQVLILLLGKRTFGYRKKHGKKVLERSDDNKLDLTYKELDSRGISQQRATRSIDELLAKGFIEIVNPGGLFEKDKALYALIGEYRFWKSGYPPIRTRQRDVKRGYQGRELGATSKVEKTNFAHVNERPLHTRQRETPLGETRTSTGDTL